MIKLTVRDGSDRLVVKAVELFALRWKQRTQVRLSARCEAPAWELVVETSGTGQPQSYAIATAGRTLTVNGADGHGVLYGLGYLLRQLVFEPARVKMPAIAGAWKPAVYNRGVYFATHFNNWYEAAPIGHIERYIEEMALWGCDLLTFWLDLNWYPHGFWKDPGSRGSKMVERLRRIGEVARDCGMKVGSGGLANEGFAYQPPPALRADIAARHGGFYPYSQICPSKPDGLKMILENRRKTIELVGPLDVYWHWPYDQGGCGCAQCAHAPGRWGKKFLEIGPAIAGIVRERNPSVRVLVSTWLMDETERNMVYELCDRQAGWFQGVITQTEHARERAIDPRYDWLVFPEISMFDCYFISYGSNGANPAPQRMTREAGAVARKGCGTTLYSEGIYEDVNKAIYLSMLWSPDRAEVEVRGEYCRYYFGSKNVPAAGALISGLEKTWGAAALLRSSAVEVNRLLADADRLGKRLPRHRDACERWRLLRDRAAMDQLMKQAGPAKPLAMESRAVFEGAHCFPIGELRQRLKKLLAALRQRRQTTGRLFETHWKYLKHFDLDKTVLLFLPDDVMGKQQWDTLIAPLEKAARLRDEAAMRRAVSRAFKRWFWFNGIDFNFLFQ
ncbi:MAG: hypothetical protein WCL16_00235 [bacterium]